MNKFPEGAQVVYVPKHAVRNGIPDFRDEDCEVGFLFHNEIADETSEWVFVRYFEKFSWPVIFDLPKVRTVANGERTDVKDLYYKDILPDSYIQECMKHLEVLDG